MSNNYLLAFISRCAKMPNTGAVAAKGMLKRPKSRQEGRRRIHGSSDHAYARQEAAE
jgi:hypothetical protein